MAEIATALGSNLGRALARSLPTFSWLWGDRAELAATPPALGSAAFSSAAQDPLLLTEWLRAEDDLAGR